MQAVLGIDAAWTDKNPSGLAVVVNGTAGWYLQAAYASYYDFMLVGSTSSPAAAGAPFMPSPSTILDQVHKLCSYRPAVVAVDMPLSRQPITGRRASDNAISRHYGRRHAGTHTPSALRPGLISDSLTLGFEAAGYPLRTSSMGVPGLIEVYPHPALIELTGAEERLPYKVGKTQTYWPKAAVPERRIRLLQVWERIVSHLETEISGIAKLLPKVTPLSNGVSLKAYEDTLDAVICAWVGVRALEGGAQPLGDDVSAIWVPRR